MRQPPASVVELCQELVRIPSVNPVGRPGTDATGEAACAAYIAAWLREEGAAVSLREVLPDRPNVVARFPSDRPGKPRLLLAPHTDTVSVAGMTIEPFGGELRDGRLWGRGASDTKGSIAAMLWATRLLGDRLARLPYEIWFAGLVGEEAGQHGAKALAQEESFDFVIAGEPTGMDVVFKHKGCCNLHLTTRGRAVHAAEPERGENAIYAMMAVIQQLKDEILPELAQHTDPTLGTATLSVGTIQGGSKTNIVPDQCDVTVDIRTVPGVDWPLYFDELQERLGARHPGLSVEAGRSEPLHTPEDHPIIQGFVRRGARCVGAPWFCDAAIFAQRGTPAIAMGPGSIAQAHTRDEWIEVAALERGAETFARFLGGL